MTTPAEVDPPSIDRGAVIARSLRRSSVWAVRFLILVAAGAVALWLIAQAWVGVFPLIMALLLSSVLWPPTRWLRARGWPAGLAAFTTLLIAFIAFLGILSTIAPSIVEETAEVVDRAGDGIIELQKWIAGPPLNLDNSELLDYAGQLRSALQERAAAIAAGVFTGVAAVGSFFVTTFLVLVLTFFFLKDGKNFLPALHSWTGRYAGQHLVEVSQRVWTTVSGFIRTQALVGLIDAVIIGSGLFFAGVPLAVALAVLTFFAAFVPVVGAFVAGGFAVLVALVSNGFGSAAFVLVLVLVVQQLEGNVLLPILQSKTMNLHPGVVLIAIVGGSTLFGIAGAFLAVPVVASLVVALRYYSEQVDIAAGLLQAGEGDAATAEGKVVARREESRGRELRRTIRAEEPAVDGRRHTGQHPATPIWRRMLTRVRRLLRRE
ncbi:MAG: AI-2E family transporter [Ornithinimicrobium sp.]